MASAIGRAGGNIISLDVIGSVDGVAVDDITVEADTDAVALRIAIEQVPSVVVETVMAAQDFRDPAAPLELAAQMVVAGSGAVPLLVEGLPAALWASWAIVVASTHTGPEIIHSSARPPDVGGLETPWMPLEQVRRLPRAPWMPQAWRQLADLQVVAAPLAQRNTAVVLARDNGPRFLDSEVTQLARLATIAVRVEVLGAQSGTAVSG